MSEATKAELGESAPQTPGRGPFRWLRGLMGFLRRRWVRRTLLLGLGCVVLLSLASVVPALAMKGDLERGKAELAEAERHLLDGDADGAASAFQRAEASFDAARSEPGVFLVQVGQRIPLVGRTPGALLSLSTIGRDVSGVGAEVSNRIADLPGGLAALGPKDGRLPIETLGSLGDVMHRARVVLDRAEIQAARLPDSWVIGPVASARDLLRQKLARAAPLARAVDALVSQLPAFAGENGPVRYFVAPQNLAEARGTGGLIGNFAILTIDHGRFSFGDFSSIGVLPNVPASEAPAPSPLYDAFGGGGFWLNLNMTPDVPTSSTMIESLYRRVRGTPLDGTVFVDLKAMAEMLKATGPIHVKEFRATITARNVVDFVATAKYLDIPWKVNGVRRQTLGPRLVAEAVLGKFFSQANGEDAIRALVRAAANGDILLHSAHPQVEGAFRDAGLTGGFDALDPDADFFGVITSNAAANKVDYYMQRDVRYDVSLGRDGAATARAAVTFRNLAPRGASRSYGLGPYKGSGLEPGEIRSWTSFYSPAGSGLVSATVNGRPLEAIRYRDLGMSMFGRFLEVKAGESARVGLSFDLPNAWSGDVASGSYTVRVQGQPTVRPITSSIVIEAPPGMRIGWTSIPMQVHGSRASWSGVLLPNQDITIRFGKPGVLAVWSRFWHLFSRPAIRL